MGATSNRASSRDFKGPKCSSSILAKSKQNVFYSLTTRQKASAAKAKSEHGKARKSKDDQEEEANTSCKQRFLLLKLAWMLKELKLKLRRKTVKLFPAFQWQTHSVAR